MEKIKLVIWDLDETFWKGTLSEEGIEPIKNNIEIVKDLVNRGIMNSIASKNNFDDVKEELIKLGCWESFIFPVINWGNKSQMIKEIIEKTMLRPSNILFIDDNHINLEEVKYHFPEINTAKPEFINEMLSHDSLQGKDDREHSRLKQYQILETKSVDKKNYIDNTQFLLNSNIQTEVFDVTSDNIDRVYELIDRTNQLNFTKKRISKEELIELIQNKAFETKCVSVKDNYGDYGIIGFYSFNPEEKILEHFVFSCRVLSLGIEQYFYSKLGFPKFEYKGETAIMLDKSTPSWINISKSKTPVENKKDSEDDIKILLKGGCDLSPLMHYFKNSNFKVKPEFNSATKNNVGLRPDHTVVTKYAYTLDEETKERLSKELPFVEKRLYDTDLYKQNYDVSIISLLMDYTQYVYKEIETGLMVNYSSYGYSLINRDTKDIVDFFRKRDIHVMDEAFTERFKKKFVELGQLPVEIFRENLNFIREKVSKPIIFINGAEVRVDNPREEEAFDRHILMNKELDKFIAENENCYLLDMRKFVTGEEDATDCIRHYKRHVYLKMYEELINIIGKARKQLVKL